MKSNCKCGALWLLLPAAMSFAACRKATPPEPHAPRAIAAPSETPAADKALREADDDPSWLAGTWKKDGEPRWFLFNLPAEVAELAGKPARVVRRGKLVMHGRYLSAIFENGEVQLEASRDHASLAVPGARGVFRRGAPP